MPLKFPETQHDWKFDLVGLLAILGESIVSEIVQPITASRTSFLPRLMPAPHALIRPSRRKALPSKLMTVVGVHSGTVLNSLSYFPEMIHQIDLMQPFELQVVKITEASWMSHRDPEKSYPIGEVRTFSPLRLITIFSSLWTAGILILAVLLEDGPAAIAVSRQ